MKKPLILMILDGFGIAGDKGNAIKAANKPNRILNDFRAMFFSLTINFTITDDQL